MVSSGMAGPFIQAFTADFSKRLRIRPSATLTFFFHLFNSRKELIAQYSRLSEEAARRERRAMWRVQRMRLDEARAHFFRDDGQKTQVCYK